MSFNFLGTGSYTPDKIITNEELSKMVDTSDEWITKRIGVRQRHVSVNESAADMGVKAAERAIQDAGIDPQELDLIIASTISSDKVCPGVACMVQKELGVSCPAFDVAAACTGFLFMLDVAAGYFARGAVKKVLLVSSERMSGILDWTDRGICCIFGDGAGAAVLGEGDSYLCSYFDTRGGDEVLSVPVYSDRSPFYEKELTPAAVQMNGQETYKFAVTTMPANINKVLEMAGLQPEDIAAVIPHQANYRIINEARKRVPGIPPERFHVNIENYGNTSSASVPILLDEVKRSGAFRQGDYIILVAFGGGLSSGACVVRW